MVWILALAGLATGWAGAPQTAVFDFDSGVPLLSVYQGLPRYQTVNDVTARLTGPFSVQSDTTTGWNMSQFSSQYLTANSLPAVLDITFSQYITSVDFVFSTGDFPPIETPSLLQLTAYTNSVTTPAVGTATARGAYGADTMPMGTFSFASAEPFNIVRIQMAPGQPSGLFQLDNISVLTAGDLLYTISASASPSGGGSTAGAAVYSSNSLVTLVATPSLNYAFLNWTESGVPVSTAASYSFTATADRSLVAHFIATCRITTSASPTAGGTTSGGGTYNTGSNVTVIASANPGYVFVNWTEGGVPVSTAASYSFAASVNRTLVANFTHPTVYTITATPSPSAGGTATGGGAYNSGSNATVMATANPGYAFVNWTESGAPVSTSASYSFTASANRTLVANFTAVYTITATASPSAGGTATGGGAYKSGSNVTVVATANPGYAFVNWTESGAPVSTNASYLFLASTNRALAAQFAPALTISRQSPGQILITWPGPLPEYTLQQKTVLGIPGPWSGCTNPVVVTDGRSQVTLAPPGTTCFYRLIRR